MLVLCIPLRMCLKAVVHDGQFETEYADITYLMLVVSVITQHLVEKCYGQQFGPWEECGSVLKFYFVQLF